MSLYSLNKSKVDCLIGIIYSITFHKIPSENGFVVNDP